MHLFGLHTRDADDGESDQVELAAKKLSVKVLDFCVHLFCPKSQNTPL